jgi:hypothetical protein
MTSAAPVAQCSRTASDIVAARYQAWVYPEPVSDMAEAVANGQYWDLTDPSLFRRKLWPRKIEPEYLSAPRRRASPVEEGSTQRVVGLVWELASGPAG